jgi:putative transposase
MRKKRHTPEEIVSKLRQVDVLVSQGQTVADAIRAIGVTEVTYYRWRQEYGGLKSDQVKRMKELETENQRLRKAIADLTLDKLILQEAARGNLLPPRASACLCRAHPVCAEYLRTSRLPRARAAPLDTAQSAAGPSRRRAAHRRPDRAGASVWPLRLSQDRGLATGCGLAGERQAGGADLAPRGPQSASQAAQARAAVVGGRLLPPAAARVPQSRVVV